MELLLIYALGAELYGAIEILWRGRTHWTMLLCGGVCFTIMYLISAAALPFWLKCVLSALAVTLVELIAGILVNIIFAWDVWDYSHMAFNLLGQICPVFSLCWLMLSVPGLMLCVVMRKLFQSSLFL